MKDTVLGPLFFEENLTGEAYLNVLQFELLPALVTVILITIIPVQKFDYNKMQLRSSMSLYAREVIKSRYWHIAGTV